MREASVLLRVLPFPTPCRDDGSHELADPPLSSFTRHRTLRSRGTNFLMIPNFISLE